MKGIILSAGLGTRFRPYTEKIPKPAIPLLNIPLGLHPLLHFDESLIQSAIVNLHYLPDQVEKIFDRPPFPLNVQFSREVGKPLGSGGALYAAQEKLCGEKTFWYINGDEVMTGLNPGLLKQFVEFHQSEKSRMSLLVTEHPDCGESLGAICCDSENRVIAIKKQTQDPNRFHFLGIMLIDDSVLRDIPAGVSNIFYDVAVKLIEKGDKVSAFPVKVNWFEMGNINDYMIANKTLLQYLAEQGDSEWSQKVKSFASTSRLEKTSQALIWADETAEYDARLMTGHCVLGKNSRVMAPLKDSVVGSGQTVSIATKDELIL